MPPSPSFSPTSQGPISIRDRSRRGAASTASPTVIGDRVTVRHVRSGFGSLIAGDGSGRGGPSQNPSPRPQQTDHPDAARRRRAATASAGSANSSGQAQSSHGGGG